MKIKKERKERKNRTNWNRVVYGISGHSTNGDFRKSELYLISFAVQRLKIMNKIYFF